jgi:Ran GTPase-activating protein (RanGAP) involved in mRNA processing and transport
MSSKSEDPEPKTSDDDAAASRPVNQSIPNETSPDVGYWTDEEEWHDILEALDVKNARMSHFIGNETYLDLEGRGCEEVKQIAAELATNRTLTTLRIGSSQISVDGVLALARALTQNSTLSQLTLTECQIGSVGAQALAEALKQNTSLRSLTLWNGGIDETGASAIATVLHENTTLKSVNLGDNRIGDIGVSAIAMTLNKSVTDLRVSRCNISDDGSRVLAQFLKRNFSLTILFLNHNKITAAGASYLAEALKENKALRTLYLNANSIGNDGAAFLAEALRNNATLTSLHLLCNGIGDEGAALILSALKECNTTLTYLVLLGNYGVSSTVRAAVDEIVKANEEGTRHCVHPVVPQACTTAGQSEPAFALVQQQALPNAEPMPPPAAPLELEVKPTAQRDRTMQMSSPRATASTRGSPPHTYFDSLAISSNDESNMEWMRSSHQQHAETEIRRLKSVREACIDESAGRDQGISSEMIILQLTESVSSGKYPTVEELEKMVHGCARECEAELARNKVVPLPLRERWLELNKLLAQEREAEARVRVAMYKRSDGISVAEDHCSVIAARQEGIPTNYHEILPYRRLTCITRGWNQDQVASDMVPDMEISPNHPLDGSEPLQKSLCDESRQRKGREAEAVGGLDLSAAKKASMDARETAVDAVGNTGWLSGVPSDLVRFTLANSQIGLAKFFSSDLTTVPLCLKQSAVRLEAAITLALKDNTTTHLNLSSNFLGDSGAEAIVCALQWKTKVVALDLSTNSISSGGASAMSQRLRANHTLKILFLSCNFLGPGGAEALADLLKHNSTLRILGVRANMFGDDGARALSEAMKVNTTLTFLDLGVNAISDSGAIRIAKALKLNAVLTKLNLSNNKIGTIGACSLSDALDEPTSLTYLDLARNMVGPHGATALALGLKQNAKLTHFNLSYNDIGCVGAIAFADALTANGSLTNLDLEGNSIGSQGARALQVSLGVNTILTSVNLRYNDFCNDDVLALKGVQSGVVLFLDEQGQ